MRCSLLQQLNFKKAMHELQSLRMLRMQYQVERIGVHKKIIPGILNKEREENW